MTNLRNILVNIGLLVILGSLVLPFFHVDFTLTRWIFAGGAAVNLIGTLLPRHAPACEPLRLRRLYRLEMWSSLFFAVGAGLMWIRQSGEYDWLAFTLAGGVIYAYASFMIARQAND